MMENMETCRGILELFTSAAQIKRSEKTWVVNLRRMGNSPYSCGRQKTKKNISFHHSRKMGRWGKVSNCDYHFMHATLDDLYEFRQRK